MFLEKLIAQATQLHWLLPSSCILCGATGTKTNLCVACQQDLPILPHHCQQCAQFLLYTPRDITHCGSCLAAPPPFERTYALYRYDPPVVQLVTRLKFQQQLTHARAFGELLGTKIVRDWYRDMALPELIIPVPLHAQRLQERGFNQALEICRPIARLCKLPIAKSGVTKVKSTPAQSGLAAFDRKANIANAFKVSGDYAGLRVAVVDDVITTGSTVRELCKALKARGVKQIDVWCVARTSLL